MPVQSLATAVPNHDVILIGESELPLHSFLFDHVAEQVTAQSLGPVIVGRREPSPKTNEGPGRDRWDSKHLVKEVIQVPHDDTSVMDGL